MTTLCVSLLFSCSKKAEHRSLSNRLEDVDSLIAQHDYDSACRELEAIEENAYSHWDFLSIFRRYKIMGESRRCENTLRNGLGKNPDNLELTCVLTNFYLKEGNIDAALDRGKILQGTKYGSVYSEAVFKETLQKNKSGDLDKVFKNQDLYPVYYDCYVGTENQCWLIDCALLRLSQGAYESAASIHPGEVERASDALFWALVMFDARRFGDSINYSQATHKLLKDSRDSGFKGKNKVDEVLLASIEADAFTALMDQESAEKVRKQYIDQMKDAKGNFLPLSENADSRLLPYMFVNSAKWASENDNDDECRKLITYACDNWPDFVPALALYADFAWRTSSVRKESESQMALRDVGITSVEQQRYDNRVKVPVEDAVFRIDEGLAATNNPLLFILSLEMHYRLDKTTTPKEKIAGLWKILEKNQLGKHIYPNLLLDYFMVELIKNNQHDVALDLFMNFLGAKYEKAEDKKFWEFVIEKKSAFTVDEIEFLAYFATYCLKEKEALELYEYAVYEHTGEAGQGFVSPGVSDSACINLAMLYNCIGRKQDSIDLYNSISSRTGDMKVKSMIIYRIAMIFYSEGDVKNARRCAEYAVELDKGNAQAALLKSKLRYE